MPSLFLKKSSGPTGSTPSLVERPAGIGPLRRSQQPAVPDTRVRRDDPRAPWIGFDLPPELADEHTQHVEVVRVPRPPDALEEPAVRQQLPGVLRQGLQEAPLRLREADLLAGPFDAVRIEVDLQVLGPESGGA